MSTADLVVSILNKVKIAAGISTLDMQMVYVPKGKAHDDKRMIKAFNIQQERIKTARDTIEAHLNKDVLGADVKAWWYITMFARVIPDNTFWRAVTEASECFDSKNWGESMKIMHSAGCKQL